MEILTAILTWLYVNHVALFGLIVAMYATFKHFMTINKKNELITKTDKAKAIISIAPHIVRVVSDIVGLVGNEKADAFIAELKIALEALGFELLPEEYAGVKIIGSGIHKSQKLDKKEVETDG